MQSPAAVLVFAVASMVFSAVSSSASEREKQDKGSDLRSTPSGTSVELIDRFSSARETPNDRSPNPSDSDDTREISRERTEAVAPLEDEAAKATHNRAVECIYELNAGINATFGEIVKHSEKFRSSGYDQDRERKVDAAFASLYDQIDKVSQFIRALPEHSTLKSLLDDYHSIIEAIRKPEYLMKSRPTTSDMNEQAPKQPNSSDHDNESTDDDFFMEDFHRIFEKNMHNGYYGDESESDEEIWEFFSCKFEENMRNYGELEEMPMEEPDRTLKWDNQAERDRRTMVSISMLNQQMQDDYYESTDDEDPQNILFSLLGLHM